MARSATTTRPTRSIFMWLVLALIVTVIVTLTGGIVVLVGGSVQGREFSPHLFRERGFSYIRLPVVRLQIAPTSRWLITNDLLSHLTRNGYVTPVSQNARWDVVEIDANSRAGTIGDAQLALVYFNARNEQGASYWLEWTKAHGEQAKVFWPYVAQVTRDELYVLLPDLFRLAEQNPDSSPSEFAQQLQEWLSDRYVWYAGQFAEAKQPQRARDLLERAKLVPPELKAAKPKLESLEAAPSNS